MAEWVDLAVKTSALVLMAAMIVGLMRRASAASRHLVWTGMFAAALMLPVARFTLPALTILVWPADEQTVVPVAPAGTASPIVGSAMGDATPAVSIPESIDAPAPGTGRISWRTTFLSIWLAGVSLFLLRIVAGTIGTRRAASRWDRVTDAALLTRLERLKSDFGVRRPIALHVSRQSSMPTTWGILRPAIFLPQDMVDSHSDSPDAINPVLIHEVSHIARFDALSQLIARLAVALWWFNPLFWIANREARFERECACDDAVLTRGSRASDYAGQLIKLARSMRSTPNASFGAIAMARASDLEQRVRAILRAKANRSRRSRASVVVASALLITMLPIAAVRLGARPSMPESATVIGEINEPPAIAAAVASGAAISPQIATQQPPQSTGSLTWPQERIQMLSQLHGLANRFYADVLKMIEIGTMPVIDAAPFRDALQRVEMALKVEQQGRASADSEADKQRIRTDFAHSTSELGMQRRRFETGMTSATGLADLLIATLSFFEPQNATPIRFVTPSGTNRLEPNPSEVIAKIQEAARITAESARADALIKLAQTFRFTPAMVTLYVAVADAIGSDADRKRVFDQPLKVKAR